MHSASGQRVGSPYWMTKESLHLEYDLFTKTVDPNSISVYDINGQMVCIRIKLSNGDEIRFLLMKISRQRWKLKAKITQHWVPNLTQFTKPTHMREKVWNASSFSGIPRKDLHRYVFILKWVRSSNSCPLIGQINKQNW